MSALKVQAICPKCGHNCGIKYAKGDGTPLLAQNSAPRGDYGWRERRCDATGSDATSGVTAWIERTRESERRTVDLTAGRLRAAEEAHAKELATIRSRCTAAQSTLDALAKIEANLAKGGCSDGR